MIEEIQDKVYSFHNPNKKLYDEVIKQLVRVKFYQRLLPQSECLCCGKIGGKFRFPFIRNSKGLCSKSCYQHYYGISDRDYYFNNNY